MALDGNKTGSAVYNLIKTTQVSDEASCEKLWQEIVTKIFDALILGGGASGIIAAIKLAERNKKVGNI